MFHSSPIPRLILAILLSVSTTGLQDSAFAQEASSTPPTELDSTAGKLRLERLAALEYPWGMALLPDGKLLITEKPGRLKIWDGAKLSDPLEGIPQVIYRGGRSEQGGLMDVAIDPDFATNRWVYLSYTEAAGNQPETLGETGDMRFGGNLDLTDNILRGGAVARAKLEDNRLRDLQVIWRQVPKTVGRGHFGNRLIFDKDGKLFITSADRMRFDPAQNLESNLGKVVRINADGSLPDDNPFQAQEKARGDIWTYGHRNILAAAIQPETGHLWAVEMGPLGGDELNRIERGKNYGWPYVSNGDNYDGSPIPDHGSSDKYEAPVRSWTPVISPSGAAFYTSTRFPNWKGSLLVGGLSSQSLIRLVVEKNQVLLEERLVLQRRIRDVLEAPNGTLLLLTDAKSAELLRLSPAN